MKNKILLLTLILCLGVIASGVFASSQAMAITVDIPSGKGVYKSKSVTKDYVSNQKVYHISTMSNHDGSKTNMFARLYNVDYDSYSSWVEFGPGDDHSYGGIFRNTGNYKLEIKNSKWSIYTYFTSGTWQYSI